MEEERDAVWAKVNKISTIFSSLTDTVTRPPGLINIEKLNKQNAQAVKTQPQNPEEFYNRVSSFRPGLWTVQELTPLECARWGWRIQEKDILQCVTCREVVCAILPDVRDFKAYEKYLGLLKSRIVEAHKDACGWKHNPSPEEFVQPPYIGSIEDMRNLTNSARTLAALNSALPYLDVGALSDSLGADRDLIVGLFQNDSTDYEVQASSVLLVLSGWIRGEGAYLRCKVCRRSVGLWSFITRADELDRTRAISPVPTPSGKRKRNEEQVEETVEDEEMDQDNTEGPSPAGSRICPPRKCKLLKTDSKGSDSGEKINEENNTAGEEGERKGEENVQKEQEKEMEVEDGDKEKENGQKEKTIAKEAEGEKTNEDEVQEKMEEGSSHNEKTKGDNSRKEMDSEERKKMEEGDEKERDELQEKAGANNNSGEKENEAVNNGKEDEKKEEQQKEEDSENGKNESLAGNKTEKDDLEDESEENKGNDNKKSGEMAAENKEDEEKTVNVDSKSEEKRHNPDNSDASEDSRKDSPKDDTKTSQTGKDKQGGDETADKEKEEESPEKINTTGDKEQRSKETSRVQDSCTSQKKSILPSPLIIGSSPSTQIRKIGEKQYFHPLEEHRHWCTWTMKILLEEIDEEMSLEKRGYQMVTEQARDILDFANRKDLCSSEKYIRNVEGLRSIRTMLNGLASVDTWLSEDIAEK
ncbi:cyclic nucleotide-gated cation channel beta-1-like [Penaeus indicus]|uniref:cyclic nucleotide-gated cation channel beta-1-like n=1 Tax=Penaeus indicus TaxID=29960 RepID=UPI00300BFF4E